MFDEILAKALPDMMFTVVTIFIIWIVFCLIYPGNDIKKFIKNLKKKHTTWKRDYVPREISKWEDVFDKREPIPFLIEHVRGYSVYPVYLLEAIKWSDMDEYERHNMEYTLRLNHIPIKGDMEFVEMNIRDRVSDTSIHDEPIRFHGGFADDGSVIIGTIDPKNIVPFIPKFIIDNCCEGDILEWVMYCNGGGFETYNSSPGSKWYPLDPDPRMPYHTYHVAVIFHLKVGYITDSSVYCEMMEKEREAERAREHRIERLEAQGKYVDDYYHPHIWERV